MTSNSPAMSVEDVLEQFMMEYKKDNDTLERYVRMHPQFAAQLIDLSKLLAIPDVEDDCPLSATDQSRIDAAWIMHSAARPASDDPFATLTGARSKAMSITLGVPRQVITCFRERKIDPSTVPHPILRHFVDEFQLPMAHVIAAMNLPAQVSPGRSYKADGKPGISGQISFEQVLIDAGLSNADARLLADD
ncbi:MAG: hypothetical protein QHC89_14995 [Bosea sp. (in: a-proteobacteria)]|nr:hypothetical protein [Bosea sp. (in: a-proteobacteria)]